MIGGEALDPATLRAIAAELDEVADEAGPHVHDDMEVFIASYAASYAATLRTRALRVEMFRAQVTTELPIVEVAGDTR